MTIDQKAIEKWGGEALHIRRDGEAAAWIITAVHDTQRGPSAGGVRMKSYTDLAEAVQDAMNLSAAMTMKFATVRMPWGGGKTVVYLTRPLDAEARHELLLRLGDHIKKLNGQYYAGPDIGTSSEDMDVLHGVAAPYIFSRTAATGGSGSSSVPTAYGVFAAIRATHKEIYGNEDLNGKRILIQGMGNVGSFLAKLLHKEGATILFSETNPDTVASLSGKTDYRYVAPEDLFQTPCDIFSPCAQGGNLNSDTIPRLLCKGIAGAANNQLLDPEEHIRLLQAHNIVYAPDFVCSLGGAMGITLMEGDGIPYDEVLERVQNSIGEALRGIFSMASTEKLDVVRAAYRYAGMG